MRSTEKHRERPIPQQDDPFALWPERIRELTTRLRSEHDRGTRERTIGEVWLLIGLALGKYVRLHAVRLGGIDREDAHDLVADKALELVGSIERSSWDPSTSSPAQICAFVASVARNALVDRLRARERELPAPATGDAGTEDPIETAPVRLHLLESPDAPREQAWAILDCSRVLSRRARSAWFLRVFLELPSAVIARHPEVASNPRAVDMMLQRCRDHMRDCMKAKGFDSPRFPAGTFAALWGMMEEDEAAWARPRLEEP